MSCKCNHATPIVKFAKINESAVIPKYAREGDAGFDFYALEGVTIPPNSLGNMVPTGLKVWLPDNYELQVRDKSGMCVKTSIRVANAPGTVDSGYTGEIQILIDNFSDKPYVITKENRRIAQGVVKFVPPIIIEEISLEEIENRTTERGDGGFGSTKLD